MNNPERDFSSFLQSLKVNATSNYSISASFLIHCSLLLAVIQTIESTSSEVLTASINEAQLNKNKFE
jgi:hypothetical protein